MKLFLVCFSLAIAGQSAELPTKTFFDDTFDSGWSVEHYGSYVEIASGRVESSELGAHGYRTTLVVGAELLSRITYRAEHVWQEAAYYPLIDGPIKSVTWDVRYRTSKGDHVLNLIARQNGSIYMSPLGEIAWTEYRFWQHHTVSIDPATFSKIRGDGPSTLDFTTCGSPIQFGYVNYNESPGGIPNPPGPDPSIGEFDLTLYNVKVIPDSQFKFSNPLRNADGTVSFTWNSMLAIYVVEFSDNPADSNSWFALQPTLHISSNCVDSITIRTDGLPKAFFRVRRY